MTPSRSFPLAIAAAVLISWFGAPLVAGAEPLTASAPACSPTSDTTTGGGWLLPTTRQKRTFGFAAGIGPDAPILGRLVYVNHITNERLEGAILLYIVTPPNSRHMEGEGDANGEPAAFTLDVVDNSTSGNGDVFSLSYTTPTRARSDSAPLGGGNITIHQLCAASPPAPGVL